MARLSALFFRIGPHAGVGACKPPPPHAINELERLKKILDRGSMRVGKGRMRWEERGGAGWEGTGYQLYECQVADS